MSHALLLRLFLSPFFNISVALHYLKTYPDSIGISHYLCWRMRSMPAEEVEFYWPQMCHLIVTRPTKSNALECFVMERAEESTHSAMLTFWFMQSALHDLSSTRTTNPKPFLICQRILHRCHEIIFGDLPEPSASPYKSLPTSPHASHVALGNENGNGVGEGGTGPGLSGRFGMKRNKGERVNNHIPPAIVGIGMVMAGAPGMPALTEMIGPVAIMQGRIPRDDQDDGRKRAEVDKDGGADGPRGGEREITRSRSSNGAARGGGSMLGNGPPRKISEEESEDGSGTEAATSPRRTSEAPDGQIRLGRSLGGTAAQLEGDPRASSIRLNSPPRSSGLTGPKLNKMAARNRAGKTPGPAAVDQSRFDNQPRALREIHPSHTSPSLVQHSQLISNTNLPSPSAPNGHRRPSNLHITKSPDVESPLPSATFNSSPSSPVQSRIPPLNRRVSPHNAPFYSTPALGAVQSSKMMHYQMPSPEALLSMYDLNAQRQLLRSHYCRTEFNFLSTLEDISNRLLVIPKIARVSALRAELTSLNHKLPAEVCMPMWCSADHSHEDGGETSTGNSLRSRKDKDPRGRVRAHHRVVRISPGDSVVLNSAEKAPYLIHLEILENDLDFDPSKRSNRELLKQIVVQEERKKRKRQGIEVLDYPNRPTLETFASSSSANGSILKPPPSPRRMSTRTTPSRSMSNPGETEEMDLVEQLFGAKFSIKSQTADFQDSLPIPLGPQNKHLDSVAWSRTEPITPSLFSNGESRGSERSPSSPRLPSTPTLTTSPQLAQQPSTPGPKASTPDTASGEPRRIITLDDYSERMRTAAVMLAQLNASMMPERITPGDAQPATGLRRIPGAGWVIGSTTAMHPDGSPLPAPTQKMKLQVTQAQAIKDRIMQEMMGLEDERVQRMTSHPEGYTVQPSSKDNKTAEDEGIIRRELNKADPSAAVFQESWTAKKSRIQAASPWGHLAAWNVLSVIVKTGADLRQEQLATQLIERFGQIFEEEKCECWVRFFRILITGEQSGLVETITDAVSVHSIKKAEYARRMAEGNLGHVSLLDHFLNTYGELDSGRFARAQRNFVKSLAGYSIVCYLLQIKDRHNGNILIDRDGHCIHIDFGFMLSNSPGGNMGFEAAPFKLPMEYVDIMGGLDSPSFAMFRKLFKEGFEAARKHSDSILTIVELMQKDSKLDCFLLFGDQTSQHLRDRFQLGLTTGAVDAYLDRLIVTSIGSSWTKLYDSFQYYSQGVL